MAYANFKPTIWSKYIQHALAKECILVDFCNKKFQGEAGLGKTVKIQGATRPTIGTYVPGTSINSPETFAGTTATLAIDQYKYFNIAIDDVDEAQSQDGVLDAFLTEASRGLAEAADAYVGSLATDSSITGVSSSTQIASKSAALSAINAGILALRENNVGTKEQVAVEIPWFVYNLLRDQIVELKTDNDELVKKGIIGMYDNCFIRPSNNLYSDGTDTYAMIRTNNAIAFANGIQETEAYRPHDSFTDAVKGLHVYGAKVIRPAEIYVLKCHK